MPLKSTPSSSVQLRLPSSLFLKYRTISIVGTASKLKPKSVQTLSITDLHRHHQSTPTTPTSPIQIRPPFRHNLNKMQQCDSISTNWGNDTFPESEPIDVGPGHILPLVGFTKVGEQGPNPPLPTAHVDTTIPKMLTISPWGRGDSAACKGNPGNSMNIQLGYQRRSKQYI